MWRRSFDAAAGRLTVLAVLAAELNVCDRLLLVLADENVAHLSRHEHATIVRK